MKRVRALVVDGRGAAAWPLPALLAADARIEVAGCVQEGLEALAFLGEKEADVVVMDLGDDRYEATRRIMERRPRPIVLVAPPGEPDEVARVFKALEAGAVAGVARPLGPNGPDGQRLAAELCRVVVLMSEVKVVRRWPGRTRSAPLAAKPSAITSGVVGIGASTGGPPALQTILAGLPRDFPLPILVVQHISKGFLPGLAAWLGQTTAMQVHIAANGLQPRPGHVYFAPDDFHLELDAQGCIRLAREPQGKGLRPSVDRLFRSLAAHCGPAAIGVLLTGMGRDGAAELLSMRERGAHTIVQDRETSVIHGMPGAAVALDAAVEILPVEAIADALSRVAHHMKVHS